MVSTTEIMAYVAAIRSIKIETPQPAENFTNPHIWIYTEDGERYTEDLASMMNWLYRRHLIEGWDQKALEVNPGTGWVPTFNWIFSGQSPITDHGVMGAWIQEQVSRREQSKRKIEFLIYGN